MMVDKQTRQRPTGQGLILLIGGVLVALAVVARLRSGTERVAWATDVGVARRAAAAAGKPVLMDFTATWCPPCQDMIRTTWADAATAKAVADRSVPVRVDADAHPDVMRQYAVEFLPTLVLTGADGREIGRTSGYQSAEQVRQWLAGAGR